MNNMRVSRSVRFGLICCPVGFFVGAMMWHIAPGKGYWMYLIYASVAAFIGPALCWHFVVERTHASTLRGMLAGIGGAMIGHISVFIMSDIATNLQIAFKGQLHESQNREILLIQLQTLPLRIIFSFILFGWLTLPMGGYIGNSYVQKTGKGKDITTA